MGNTALQVNSQVGAQADLAINTHGSDWYYTVCAVMGVCTFAFIGMSIRQPRTHRLFHYITAAITLVACIAYFSMGSNLGQVPILAEFIRHNNSQVRSAGTREIFYARYIDWVVTTPLLLLDLLLTAALPWPTIMITLLVDEVMIVTGLIGALTSTVYKWGFFTAGCVAMLFVLYQLAWVGRRHAAAIGGNVHRTYMAGGVVTLFIWCLYPIAWGLCEGGNVIHPDAEAIFYGVLDLIAKPVFGFILVLGHHKIDPASIGLHIRDVGENPEKPGRTGPTPHSLTGRQPPLDGPAETAA